MGHKVTHPRWINALIIMCQTRRPGRYRHKGPERIAGYERYPHGFEYPVVIADYRIVAYHVG